jgi:L-lactate dehydrogenase (cytochrome)
VGRSVMYGLGAAGGRGLSDVLDLIGHEVSTVMGLVGCRQSRDIDSGCLASQHGNPAIHVISERVAE